jgi:copper chaperone CopZ
MRIFKTIILSMVLLSLNLLGQDTNTSAKTSYEITFTVNGMTCEGCVENVQNTLKAVKGVTGYDVQRKENRAIVEFDPKVTNADKIEAALKKTSYEIKKENKDNEVSETK